MMMIYSILQIELISTKQCDSWLKFIFYIYPKQQQQKHKRYKLKMNNCQQIKFIV